MFTRQRARVAIGAGLAAAVAGSALAFLPSAQAATAPGWRLLSSLHHGPASDINGLNSVVPVSKTDAWAFGGSNVDGTPGNTPIAEHWNGSHWNTAALPAGLTGEVGAGSAPSRSDIWAVGTGTKNGYVLHYNGKKWLVAKRWKQTGGLAQFFSGITAFSATNVWVFGGPGGNPGFGAWHLHGRTWTKVSGVPADITEASALSASNIWAFGASTTAPNAIVEHYNGHSWKQQKAAALDNLQLTSVLAESADSVWVAATIHTDNTNVPWLAHWNGKKWARYKVPYPVLTAGLTSDGSGGVWVTAQAASGSNCYAVHRSEAGKWRRYLVTSTGFAVAIARIPDLTSLWTAGRTSSASGASAGIWAYGHVG
jgi:hypothetical protein